VELLDPQGRNPKVRPAVVLTPTADIAPEGTVWVAAVTGQTDDIPEGFAVPLPWHRNGHPETKLTKPCAVACHWVAQVPVSAIVSARGQVPTRLLFEVLDAVRQLPGGPFPPPPAGSP
jgi:mRNA-degrading endonuclease toxin of MazEF toxin-antitoxin module